MQNFLSRTVKLFQSKALILCIVFLSIFLSVHAQVTTSNGSLSNPLPNVKSIPDFLKAIILALTEFGTIIGALAIMYGGFLYATAQGDEEKLNQAKLTLTWAMVGTAI